MILDASHIDILTSALLSYINDTDEYSIDCGIIGSSEFDDIEFGLSTKKADELLEQLESDNLFIDDNFIDDILNIVLTYKGIINYVLKYESNPESDILQMKTDRKSLNSLIRFIKSYALQNNIYLSCLDDDSDDDIL